MPTPSRDDRRSLLAADCANCFGLCCVALSFARSADFAFDKPAGEPCANLQTDFACGIHERLRPSGFRGCTVFDCSGAGQKVSRDMYGGVSWRDDPAVRAEMFAVFPVVRDLHELLWYLAEASELSVDAALRDEVAAAFASTRDLTDLAPGDLLSRDIEPLRSRVGEMLMVNPHDMLVAVLEDYLVVSDGTATDLLDPGPDWVGAWTDPSRGMTQHLTAAGRYSETRGGRRNAYTGRFWAHRDWIAYLDDTGFWAFGQRVDGVLHHGGFVLRRASPRSAC